jgi:hypothetical protein
LQIRHYPRAAAAAKRSLGDDKNEADEGETSDDLDHQDCANGQDCTITCDDGEIALNAVGAAGPAALRAARLISCGTRARSD